MYHLKISYYKARQSKVAHCDVDNADRFGYGYDHCEIYEYREN